MEYVYIHQCVTLLMNAGGNAILLHAGVTKFWLICLSDATLLHKSISFTGASCNRQLWNEFRTGYEGCITDRQYIIDLEIVLHIKRWCFKHTINKRTNISRIAYDVTTVSLSRCFIALALIINRLRLLSILPALWLKERSISAEVMFSGICLSVSWLMCYSWLEKQRRRKNTMFRVNKSTRE